MRFETPTNDAEYRLVILDVLGAALDAVDPASVVRRSITTDGERVTVAGRTFGVTGRVVVLAFGKASSAMAGAAVTAVGTHRTSGVVVSPDGATVPTLRSFQAEHPVPGEGSLRAAQALLDAARATRSNDLVIALVSGGGSALAEMPASGLELTDVAGIGQRLLLCGASIDEVNSVRTHLSAIKGGRLGAACGTTPLVTLVLSDVPGDDPGLVASGPTVAPSSTPQQALEVLAEYAIDVPEQVRRHLKSAVAQPVVADHPVEVVGSGGTAAAAAVHLARRRGITAAVSPHRLDGQARMAGRRIVADPPTGMTVYSGETWVRVTGNGSGGRNQEVALSAAMALDGRPGIIVAAMGTDGIDGTTDAAGGFADDGTVERARRSGCDPVIALDANDSNMALNAAGDLIVTGPTGTNVADLTVVWKTA